MKKALLLFFYILPALIFAGDIKLPSGRVLKNVVIGPMAYTTGAPSSLVLKYETSVDIESRKAVTEEVEDVWTSYRLEVERHKYISAIITVMGPPTKMNPIVSHSKQRNFVFEKKDGVWKMLSPFDLLESKEPKKEASLRSEVK